MEKEGLIIEMQIALLHFSSWNNVIAIKGFICSSNFRVILNPYNRLVVQLRINYIVCG